MVWYDCTLVLQCGHYLLHHLPTLTLNCIPLPTHKGRHSFYNRLWLLGIGIDCSRLYLHSVTCVSDSHRTDGGSSRQTVLKGSWVLEDQNHEEEREGFHAFLTVLTDTVWDDV